MRGELGAVHGSEGQTHYKQESKARTFFPVESRRLISLWETMPRCEFTAHKVWFDLKTEDTFKVQRANRVQLHEPRLTLPHYEPFTEA